jgi:hypothetical protein
VTMITRTDEVEVPEATKPEVAERILDLVLSLRSGRTHTAGAK